MRRALQALVFGVVLTIAVVAGVLNARWGGYGWYVQVNVYAPSNVEVYVVDQFGNTAYITGSGSASLGPVYEVVDLVGAKIASGPSGCTI